MNNMKYKAILFDLDNTLCNTSQTKESVFTKVHDECPKLKELPLEAFLQFILKEREEYLERSHGLQTYSRIEVWQKVMSKSSVSLSVKELKEIIDKYWEYSVSDLKLFDDVKEVLEKIVDSGLVSTLLTGGDFYSKANKLIHLGIDNNFKYVFTADLVKMPITSTNIYKYVAEFLKIDPENVLSVGDNPWEDIAPANKTGINSVQVMILDNYKIAQTGYEKPSYVIYKITDLLKILGI